MSSPVATIVLLHIGLGLLLILPVGVVLYRKWQPARRAGVSTHLVWIVLSLFFLLCSGTGAWLFARAFSGSSTAHDTISLALHIGTGFLAVLIGVGLWLHVAPSAPNNGGGNQLARTGTKLPYGRGGPLLIAFAAIVLPGALWAGAALPEYSADRYYRDLTATNSGQANNPSFPAGLRLVDRNGSEKYKAKWNPQPSAYCGRPGCHESAYQQWLPSAHHLAGIDRFYSKSASLYKDASGSMSTRWCEGCHAPNSAAIPDRNNPTVKTNESDSSSSRSEGVGCVACHATVGSPSRSGNGNYQLAEIQDYPFSESTTGWKHSFHDFLLRVRPGPHQRSYWKPELIATSEFCAGCHRQSFNVAQNHYQFIRGADEYGEWLASPYSGSINRSASASVKAIQTCQDCHFEKSADGHFLHGSTGANTALAYFDRTIDKLKQTEEFLKKSVSLDIFALRRSSQQAGVEENWVAPLDSHNGSLALKPGENVTIDIVVKNKGVGHSFPGGYLDIKDAWLEVELLDRNGKPLLSSGSLPEHNSPLPPDTHSYRMIPVDRNGDVITDHNLTKQIYTHGKRSIPAGGSDIARFQIVVPHFDSAGKPLTGQLTLIASLNYRHISPEFANTALNSTRPNMLPISVLAQTDIKLRIGSTGQAPDIAHSESSGELADRFISYGDGLLSPLERPDLSRALRAFRSAKELTPLRPEPYIGMGKVFLAEPDLISARAQFEQALRLSPQNYTARLYLGEVLSKQGDYDGALKLLKPLADKLPQDSDLQFQTGLAYFKNGSYSDAALAFERALAADPDNASAHYQLKQCYHHLKRVPEERREESIWLYLVSDAGTSALPQSKSDRVSEEVTMKSIQEHKLIKNLYQGKTKR